MTPSVRTNDEEIRIRLPEITDAARIARLGESLSDLDRYSPYLYVVLCDKFARTCVVAEQAGDLVGFITGFRVPDAPDRLFVWQVGVHEKAQGRGLAGRMLDDLFARSDHHDLRWLETTVTQSNLPSRRLFSAFARRMGAPLQESPGYVRAYFPDDHDDEPLLCIGPIERSQL